MIPVKSMKSVKSVIRYCTDFLARACDARVHARTRLCLVAGLKVGKISAVHNHGLHGLHGRMPTYDFDFDARLRHGMSE